MQSISGRDWVSHGQSWGFPHPTATSLKAPTLKELEDYWGTLSLSKGQWRSFRKKRFHATKGSRKEVLKPHTCSEAPRFPALQVPGWPGYSSARVCRLSAARKSPRLIYAFHISSRPLPCGRRGRERKRSSQE